MSIAFWCILIAGILPPLTVLYAKWHKDFDNNNPREWLSQQTDAKQRAVAAMNNGYEGFPLFAAAVLVAHAQGADSQWLNGLAALYIATRVLYIPLYIKGWGSARSIVWIIGFISIVALFVKAAA